MIREVIEICQIAQFNESEFLPKDITLHFTYVTGQDLLFIHRPINMF